MKNHTILKGVKVLDFTRVLSGPYATMILGDLGAEVIKIEPPGGDESRSWPPILEKGESAYFMALNRNKKSLALNLKNPQAQTIAQRLAAQADVVVENFTPGVVAKLGIDFDTLHKINPKLVYCSISGFGQSGPYRDKKAYDPIIQGMTGLMSITGDKEGPPAKVGIPITDLTAACNGVIAILAAHISRLQTGKGQYIDISLYDGMVSMLTIMAMDYFATGQSPERWGLDHIHRVPARAFMAKDGRYVQVAATSDIMFTKFCRVLGIEEMVDDPRCRSNHHRVRHRAEIMPVFEAQFEQKNSAEWLSLFEEAGIPCGPILEVGEVFSDPHIAARKMQFTMPHPVEGQIPQLGFPYKFSATPPSARHRPPLLGEHADKILKDILGYNRDQVVQLREDGVLAG